MIERSVDWSMNSAIVMRTSMIMSVSVVPTLASLRRSVASLMASDSAIFYAGQSADGSVMKRARSLATKCWAWGLTMQKPRASTQSNSSRSLWLTMTSGRWTFPMASAAETMAS